MEVLPKDIRMHVLYPFMYGESFEDCVRDYPIIEVIESHPKFDVNNCLVLACKHGHLNIVEWTFFVDVICSFEQPIRIACGCGHLPVVKYLVTETTSSHTKNFYALPQACAHGRLDVVKYLVSVGARINENSIFGACQNGHLNVVEYLFSFGIDDWKIRLDALSWACKKNHMHIVKYLVGIGIDIHGARNYILRQACWDGQIKVVEYILKLNGSDDNHDKCLRIAIQNGHINVLKCFLSHPCVDVDWRRHKTENLTSNIMLALGFTRDICLDMFGSFDSSQTFDLIDAEN